jgi:predicted SAM-dependent methyltransferase
LRGRGLHETLYIQYASLSRVPNAMGRLRLGYRWSRYLLCSAGKADLNGMRAAISSLARLGVLAFRDVCLLERNVECNICGWSGADFYPNTGPGYFELKETCPRCSCVCRHRALAVLLDAETEFFSPDKMVIEASPARAFQEHCLRRKARKNYLSLDLDGFGTTTRFYADASCDYFLCLHVLEHVAADTVVLREIQRVLRAGGEAVLQVPIDYRIAETVEYERPNLLENGHVRRYSESGFVERLINAGFAVRKVSVEQLVSPADLQRYGMNREPVYFAAKLF